MALIDLPPELLVAIASFLGSTGSISKFARTNRHLFQVLEHYLYRYDVKTSNLCPKALSIASCFPRSRSDANSIISKSLAAGADVNASFLTLNFDSKKVMRKYLPTIAISMAAMTGNAALVRILLEAGAKVNATCYMDGGPVLSYALRADNIETVHLLLAQPGIHLRYWDPQHDTALLTAVARDKLDFAELLLPLVNPNQTGNRGETPLELAVQHQNYSMVSLLLSDPRTNPHAGRSVFALACSLSSTKIVELLHDDLRTDVEFDCWIDDTPAGMAFAHAEFSNMDFLIRSNKCWWMSCAYINAGKQCGFGDSASVEAGENCDVVKYLFGQPNTQINCKGPGNEEILLCQVAKSSPTEMMRFLLQHEYPSRRDLGSKGTTTLLGFRPLTRTGISQVP
ncbi:hypothetical protein G3M48_005059 [Beauveria asiatica]|uniref:Ankyrin n=1 Tax=Beauveria asiatica TaxID=1069075 RepID=A0AAW0RSK1_9HYPO